MIAGVLEKCLGVACSRCSGLEKKVVERRMCRVGSIAEILDCESLLFVILHYDGSRIHVSGAANDEVHLLMQHCLQSWKSRSWKSGATSVGGS